MLTCSYWNTAFLYVFAEFFGAVIAAALVLPLYGFGQFGSLFDTRVFKAFGLAVPKHLAQVTRLLPALCDNICCGYSMSMCLCTSYVGLGSSAVHSKAVRAPESPILYGTSLLPVACKAFLVPVLDPPSPSPLQQ